MEQNKIYHVINLKLDRLDLDNDLIVNCQLVSADNQVIPLSLYVSDLLQVPELLAAAVNKATLESIENSDTSTFVEEANAITKTSEETKSSQVENIQQPTSREEQPQKTPKRNILQFSKVHKLPEDDEEGTIKQSKDTLTNMASEETDNTTVKDEPKNLAQPEVEQTQQVFRAKPTEKSTPVTQDPIFGSSTNVSLSDDESAAVIADMGDFSDKRAALIREQYGKVVD